MSDSIAGDIARRSLEAIARKDFSGWAKLVDDNIVMMLKFAPEGFPSHFEGRENCLQTMGAVFGQISQFDWRDMVVHQTIDPETVFITARSNAKTNTGKEYANEYCIHMRVKRGVVTEHTEYFNPLPVMAAFM